MDRGSHFETGQNLPQHWVLAVGQTETQRRHIGISQSEISRRWGVSDSHTRRILEGLHSCSEERLLALAVMLHIAPELLVEVRDEVAA